MTFELFTFDISVLPPRFFPSLLTGFRWSGRAGATRAEEITFCRRTETLPRQMGSHQRRAVRIDDNAAVTS
jgi:hypothetical protein